MKNGEQQCSPFFILGQRKSKIKRLKNTTVFANRLPYNYLGDHTAAITCSAAPLSNLNIRMSL